ncbi:MAG: FHA domain-containing protein [Alphaproteobacteria bacterium]|nr:FHA domain-containing protein [Alphaproteobacteria bacterium]
MSFILRQISKRVGAPDIVREKPLAAAEPVIGRGSDCDIQLTDLAVNLRHAVLKQAGSGRVTVESLGQENFEANGKFVTSASLALADTPVLGFGSHVLTLSAGDNDTVLVLATARENFAATAAGDDQKRAFSLKHALFSPRRLAWITGIFILLACMAFPIGVFMLGNQHRTISGAAYKQWSSGPLSPGHHFLEKNCESCHQQAFVSVKDSACLSCHQAGLNKLEAAHLQTRTRELGSPFAPDPAGDHAPRDRLMAASPPDPNLARRINTWVANTFSHPSNRCASCHTEHVGTGKGADGAVPAPVKPDQIRRNDCKDCHTGMAQRLAENGTPTTIPDVTDWGHHPDFRPVITTGFRGDKPVLVRTALSAGLKENDGLTFGHDVHLGTKGLVARQAMELGKANGYGAALTCDNCHKPAPDGGFVAIDMSKNCGVCHSLTFARKNGVDQQLKHGHPDEVVAQLKLYYAHQPNFSAGPEVFIGRPGLSRGTPRAGRPVDYVIDSVRNAFERGGTCTTCHTFTKPAPGSLEYKIQPVRLTARYLPSGDFDHNVPEHNKDASGAQTCKSCHKAESSKLSSDVLLPKIAECDTCHGKTKAEIAGAAGSDCAECHGFHNPGLPASPRSRELARNAMIRTD